MELKIELEKRCNECDGYGNKFDEQSYWFKCKVCNGTGKIPSETGLELIEFLKKYIPIIIFEESIQAANFIIPKDLAIKGLKDLENKNANRS